MSVGRFRKLFYKKIYSFLKNSNLLIKLENICYRFCCSLNLTKIKKTIKK